MQYIEAKDILPLAVVTDHRMSPLKCIVDTTTLIPGVKVRPQKPTTRDYPAVNDDRFTNELMARIAAKKILDERKAEANKPKPKK